jgi:hypothetical protein
MDTIVERANLKVDREGAVSDKTAQRSGPGRRTVRVIAYVEKRGKKWALLTPGKELREDGFRTRKAALDALPGILDCEEREWQRRRRAEKRAREKKAAAAIADQELGKCVLRYAERIRAAAPEGWTVEVEKNASRYGLSDWEVQRYNPEETDKYKRNNRLRGCVSITLRSEKEVLIFRLAKTKEDDTYDLSHYGSARAIGSTHFIGARTGSWCTFDRRGIDDSFYTGSATDPAEVVREQLERIAKCREASVHYISIPGWRYNIHKDQLSEVKETLKQGGSHLFTPHGMGTAHRISIRPTCSYASRLPAQTAKFFDAPVLYAETLDWD